MKINIDISVKVSNIWMTNLWFGEGIKVFWMKSLKSKWSHSSVVSKSSCNCLKLWLKSKSSLLCESSPHHWHLTMWCSCVNRKSAAFCLSEDETQPHYTVFMETFSFFHKWRCFSRLSSVSWPPQESLQLSVMCVIYLGASTTEHWL